MKTHDAHWQATTRCLVASAAFVLVGSGCSHFGGHHNDHDDHKARHESHEAHHGDRAALQLDQGRKWSTDTPLRTGMQRIRSLADGLPVAGADLDPAGAVVVADGVDEQVRYLVENCKLEPKADAALHVLLSDLLAGAKNLREPTPSPEGVFQIREVIEQYPMYFDHPGW